MAVALAAPVEKEVFLVKESPVDNIGVGGYVYSYELSNGQTHEEKAELKTVQGEEGPVETLVRSGSYSYVDPATNQVYKITYTADENGFHPEGAHIPSV